MSIHRILILFFVISWISAEAQIPTGYYNSANGLTGTALQQALHDIIDNHTVVSYTSLWTWFKQTDKKSNGKVWDPYSDIPGGTPPYEYTFVTNQCGNYNSEGDCYNREHSWPSSWFNDLSPMYTDIFHLYPTDGYVNNIRGNYPFGKVGTATWTSMNGGKKGNCVSPGYSGTVFEPRDDFKGDFARSYFYMETRYYNEDSGWPGSPMTTGSQLLPWAQTMMLLWHLQDPVSQKEVSRNDSIYKNIQHNRNPFIDHPEYAGQIWAQYMPLPSTYTWNATSGNWSTASNWTPARTVAVPGDILIFNGTVKPVSSVILDFSTVQSVGRLQIINGANVTFTGNTGNREISIGISGTTTPQLEIGSNSTLTIAGSFPLVLSLSSGYSASIAGNLIFQNAAHQITAVSAGAIVFSGSAGFTAGTGFTGSPFGTLNLNSVVFGNGTTYNLEAGSPPFGATEPNSVVVFQSGSIFRQKINASLSLSGRSYSTLIIDAPGFSQVVSTGSLACSIDHLTMANGTLAGFDFPGGVILHGNIEVNTGTLRFNSSGGSLKMDGTIQNISGAGVLAVGTNCDLIIGSTSVTTLNMNLTVGKNVQVMTGGNFTVSPGKTLVVNGEMGL